MREAAVRGLGNCGGGYMSTISIVLGLEKKQASGVENIGGGYMGDE